MRIVQMVTIQERTHDEHWLMREVPLYRLPNGETTLNADYADLCWAAMRRHCVPCPYTIPARSD